MPILDREITPELEETFLKAGIVIAHDKQELTAKTPRGENLSGIIGSGSRLDRLLRHWKGAGIPWSVLMGRRVLDIASGSEFSSDLLGTWYPHFSRLCAVNGADVFALDYHTQGFMDQQLFTGIKIDLIDQVLQEGLHRHPILQNTSFDIINSTNFVGFNMHFEVRDSLAELGITQEGFEAKLKQQCSYLLAEEGIMTVDEVDRSGYPVYYSKSEGRVAKVQRSTH